MSVLVATALAQSGKALADEFVVTNEVARDPLRADLGVELTAPDFGLGAVAGAYLWFGTRVRAGASLGIWRARFEADLDGNGINDYSSQLRGPWRNTELGADLAYAFTHRADRVSFGRGHRKLVTNEAGEPQRRWSQTTTVERVRHVALSLGARVAVGGDEVHVGLPVGLRIGSRLRTAGEHYRAAWLQARALVLPQAMEVGGEAEAMYRRAVYGISVHAQYVPIIGPTDPGGPACVLSPGTCEPAAPISSLNRVPDEPMWMVSVRVHLVLAL